MFTNRFVQCVINELDLCINAEITANDGKLYMMLFSADVNPAHSSQDFAVFEAFECNFKGYARGEKLITDLNSSSYANGEGAYDTDIGPHTFLYDDAEPGDDTIQEAAFVGICVFQDEVGFTLLGMHPLPARKLFNANGKSLEVTVTWEGKSNPVSSPAPA